MPTSYEHRVALTQGSLLEALAREQASVIVCGTRAVLRARRLLCSHDPKTGARCELFGLLKVAEDPHRNPDAWELF